MLRGWHWCPFYSKVADERGVTSFNTYGISEIEGKNIDVDHRPKPMTLCGRFLVATHHQDEINPGLWGECHIAIK